MGKIELNNRQRAIASRVIKSVKAGTQILAFVTGRAGTGKSILIKYIYKRTQNDGAVRCAMTNRAARNIGGMTLHAAFGWPLTRRIKNPQAPAHRARLIIIDEVSMMSASMLADVESQLRGARQFAIWWQVNSARRRFQPTTSRPVGDCIQVSLVVSFSRVCISARRQYAPA